jgi:hypothetical protein
VRFCPGIIKHVVEAEQGEDARISSCMFHQFSFKVYLSSNMFQPPIFAIERARGSRYFFHSIFKHVEQNLFYKQVHWPFFFSGDGFDSPKTGAPGKPSGQSADPSGAPSLEATGWTIWMATLLLTTRLPSKCHTNEHIIYNGEGDGERDIVIIYIYWYFYITYMYNHIYILYIILYIICVYLFHVYCIY